MRQTWALILDAYRDLNARKIFWIVLILSTLVAAGFAVVGLTPNGMTLFWKEFPAEFNSRVMPPATFYKYLFIYLGVHWWLGVFATVLALISTASIFPDLLSSGAIDLYLSKPISRLRLFITKYLCGLLFVALQISAFCAASFLVIGIRGKEWEPGIFLGIPIVILFYSYLYCICTLIGVMTRSTMAAILLTLLFWAFVFAIHSAETVLLFLQINERVQIAQLDARISSDEAQLRRLQAGSTQPSATTEHGDSMLPGFLRGAKANLSASRLQSQLDEERARRTEMHGGFAPWHRGLYGAMTLLPKTAETLDLLRRELISRPGFSKAAAFEDDPSDPQNDPRRAQEKTNVEMQQEMQSRSIRWVMGSSLIFELVVLSLAAWIFCRRDY
jgi:ABC-type transport system involved in multi-copper enzyme maturation permease subunit